MFVEKAARLQGGKRRSELGLGHNTKTRMVTTEREALAQAEVLDERLQLDLVVAEGQRLLFRARCTEIIVEPSVIASPNTVDIRVGAGAKARVVPIVPVNQVVGGLVARLGEVADFVVVIRGQRGLGLLVEAKRSLIVNALRRALLKRSAGLVG